MDFAPEELLIAVLARLLEGAGHVCVGRSSPIPGAAALLAQARAPETTRVSMLGRRRDTFMVNGGVELFDAAAEGRIDAFFLGGGQIDGQANINLVGAGGYPNSDVRWPGSFGSAYLYFLVPKVILFREEHSPRVFVPRIDFISAPGVGPPGVYRPGGPKALVTGKGLFSFDPERARFTLESCHPGESVETIAAATGFDFDVSPEVRETPAPDATTSKLLRRHVAPELAEVYPRFTARLFGAERAA